ncbi:MAG: FIST C-terminal domain-containing protein [Firmicutes bacterium]|nr:FIST C-terminal domain-containing protein [Bacillota bacterium]
MQIEQFLCQNGVIENFEKEIGKIKPDVVFLFGTENAFVDEVNLAGVKKVYPGALLFGCSTAGEIAGNRIFDNTLIATGIKFEHTSIATASIEISDYSESRSAGEKLAGKFEQKGLRHILVLSDGIHVNGDALVKGLYSALPEDIVVTGGLSGDSGNFKKTYVMSENEPKTGVISALGFYGDKIKIGYGSRGGWDPFGPVRMITRSENNVLYELDGRSALDLYKEYLGDRASGLPATGILFPLRLHKDEENEYGVVRTILGIDEKTQALTFAGDIPQGVYGRLMKANFDRLVDGAVEAAEICTIAGNPNPEFALLISCVGRKMVLKQRVEEEIEGVQSVFGNETVIAGFYSYGEICPFDPGSKSELHNQTMTITTFSER